MTLGDRLRELRRLGELSAREADRLACKTPGHTSLIESRGADAMAGTLAAYVPVFGVTLDWLVMGSGKTPTKKHVMDAVAARRHELAQRNAT